MVANMIPLRPIAGPPTLRTGGDALARDGMRLARRRRRKVSVAVAILRWQPRRRVENVSLMCMARDRVVLGV
jgi:hypothetical protein